MKKIILLLTIAIAAFAAEAQTTLFTVTALERNRVAMSDSVLRLNPANVVTAYSSNSKTYLTYTNGKFSSAVEYTLRETLDSIQARANRLGPNLLQLRRAMTISSTDSFRTYIFNLRNIVTSAAGTTSGLSYATSKLSYSDVNSLKTYPIVETSVRILALADSISSWHLTIAPTAYDTSSHTQKATERYIVLNSLTADTLTFLNPAYFVGTEGVTIANISTGAYTVAGGFTVQDVSEASITSIAANTIYHFKAYYNGSGYVWLKLGD